jgi:hypothetical protein
MGGYSLEAKTPQFVFGSADVLIQRKLSKVIQMRSGQFAYFPPLLAMFSDLRATTSADPNAYYWFPDPQTALSRSGQ